MIHILDLHFQLAETIAAFVVETEEGPVLVETGPYSTFSQLKLGLEGLGYRPEDIRHVLLSHIHFDHAGAAWAFARTGAKIYVHPVGYPHLLNPSRLYNSARRIYGDAMETLWGEMWEISADQLRMVEDQERFHFGGKTFTAWHTPGHASHHIAWQLDDVIFTGDVAGAAIGENGPVVPPCPPPDIDIEAWENSIDRLLALNPKALYLTHFGKKDMPIEHLAQLREVLWDWANWIKPHWEAGKEPQAVTPVFTAYIRKKLEAVGLSDANISKYEAANPAFMSVAGLMRYWKKKMEKLADPPA